MYKFDVMSITDYNEFIRLWSQTEDMELTVGDSEESLQKYLERNPGMSFVCLEERSKKVIGTILSGHDGRRGFIYHLAVDKQHRRKGIADKLISLSIDALKNDGIQRCSLMIKTTNRDAYSFWEANGWRLRTDLDMFSRDLSSK